MENLSNSAGISYFRQVKQTLYSCLNTLPSCQYGVHVIGIDEGEANSLFFFGRDPNGMVTVSLTVDGEITVPIILVLVSYEPVTWRLNLPAGVTIDRVLLVNLYCSFLITSHLLWHLPTDILLFGCIFSYISTVLCPCSGKNYLQKYATRLWF